MSIEPGLMGLLDRPGEGGGSPALSHDIEPVELVQRLQGPDGPQLMRELRQRLDELRSRLQYRASQGADSHTFEQLQAALAATAAARDILLRLPVSFNDNFDSPLVSAPRITKESPP